MTFSASVGFAVMAIICLSSTITARPQDNIGLNSNIGLGPAGNVGGGFGFQPPPKTSSAAPAVRHDMDGTTTSNNIGVNSNLGLGPVGNVGGGFGFQPPAKTSSGPALGHQEDATTKSSNVGVNSNIGLGPAGNVGGGFSFPVPSTTAKTSSSSSSTTTTPAFGHDADGSTQSNNVGINSQLGLGPLGSVGGGFSFPIPSTTAKTGSSTGRSTTLRSTTRRSTTRRTTIEETE